MSRPSFRLRLLLAGGVSILVALALATWGLSELFYRHLERAALQDMTQRVETLVLAVATGSPQLSPPDRTVVDRLLPDPRYDLPYSGRYWRLDLDGAVQQSRSLWDFDLHLPPQPIGIGELDGPQGQRLLVVDRMVDAGSESRPLRVTVALDLGEISAARQALLQDLAPWLAILLAALVIANAVQVRVGLQPFALLGRRLQDLKAARARRLGGADLPEEVRPLAEQIDDLLAAAEAENDRARRRAADLAHGLKTPLQALLGEAATLRGAGLPAHAAALEGIVQQMHLQVDRELGRLRQGQSVAVRCAVRPVVAGLVAVLQRTADGARCRWTVTGPDDLTARIDRADLTEALGALGENAARHATSNVDITLAARDGQAEISFLDDGPGVPEEDLPFLTGRGIRLDQRPGGLGLGLSIAAEIAQAAGGQLRLHNLEAGFEARLILPLAPGRPG